MKIFDQRNISVNAVLKNHIRCCLSDEQKEEYDGGRLRSMVQGLLLLTALILLNPAILSAQDFTRTITKTAEFTDSNDSGNKFRVININGPVTIEAYDGKTIELMADEEISGTEAEIEQARQELNYRLERRGNLILAWLDAPFTTLRIDGDDVHYNINRQDGSYEFIHNVRVRVPRGILLEGSTVNKGTLKISGDFREVEASNVNGALDLQHMTSITRASTVNGDITVTYDKSPTKGSEYQTVNGTIKVYTPEDLSVDVYFKSMHGDLFTDFKNIQRLKPQVSKETHSSRSATTYRVDKSTPIRINDGGPKLSFKVLNGDVYLHKQQ